MNPPGKDARLVRQSIIRPDNTNQYTAGDAIGTASSSLLTFAGVGAKEKAATGWIINATLVTSGVAGTAGDFELWLFNAAPTAAADADAFTPSDAQMKASLLGVIKFSTEIASAANRAYMADPEQLPLAFKCPDDSRTLYGVLVSRSTYTPIALEEYTVSLHVDNN
jgi:hypothetical protein